MQCRSMSFVAAIMFAAVGFVVAVRAGDGEGTPRSSSNAPASSEKEALAELKQIGGVLIHYDDRQPGRPVIAVDFTNHSGFQEAWLKHLAAFPRLSALGLSGIPLTDAGLRHLKGLTELETLTLADTRITDEGLAELLKLKKLRLLDVRGTQVTGAGVTALRRFLPELEIASGVMPDDSASPAGDRLLHSWNSSSQTAFKRVTVVAESPAASGPTRAASASLKSPVFTPLRYGYGINSSMLLVFLKYGGRIFELNGSASPAGRRSRTRGCLTFTGPTPVVISRSGR